MFMFCSLIRHKFGTLLHRLLNICAGLTECAGWMCWLNVLAWLKEISADFKSGMNDMDAHTHAHTDHTYIHISHIHTQITHMHTQITHISTLTPSNHFLNSPTLKHTCTHTQTHIHMYTHTHIHTCTPTCTHTHIHTCTHTCTHTHIHKHTSGQGRALTVQWGTRFLRSHPGIRWAHAAESRWSPICLWTTPNTHTQTTQ